MTGAGGPAPGPLVSVVIPTYRRPELLMQRALPSALTQTLRDLEVIVVVDGPDPATEAALAQVTDSRLRVLVLPQPSGGSVARNAGVEAARAPWIALLDDDDEWMPFKLEGQLALAGAASVPFPVVACCWITRTEQGDWPNPPRLPDLGEPVGDYLMARRRPTVHECGLVSALLLTRRELLVQVPFTPGLPKHQDWDWMLRVDARPDVQFSVLPEVAAISYYENNRPQMSHTLDWRWSLAWAREHRDRGRLSNRAFAGFLVGKLAVQAAREGDRTARLPLLWELLGARPRLFELLRFAAIWTVPLAWREQLRALIRRRVQRPAPSTLT